jgi:hypothetical protein
MVPPSSGAAFRVEAGASPELLDVLGASSSSGLQAAMKSEAASREANRDVVVMGRFAPTVSEAGAEQKNRGQYSIALAFRTSVAACP